MSAIFQVDFHPRAPRIIYPLGCNTITNAQIYPLTGINPHQPH
uniref:Uncharacterized protein n=1 Tax=Siphoviridae sp. ctg0K17 TaxID=2825600 RepID=A0A8S5PV22_9CAUD|nr:MAG TPA: hypothetical protein [Siphoviridae sp. ctg0K17]